MRPALGSEPERGAGHGPGDHHGSGWLRPRNRGAPPLGTAAAVLLQLAGWLAGRAAPLPAGLHAVRSGPDEGLPGAAGIGHLRLAALRANVHLQGAPTP